MRTSIRVALLVLSVLVLWAALAGASDAAVPEAPTNLALPAGNLNATTNIIYSNLTTANWSWSAPAGALVDHYEVRLSENGLYGAAVAFYNVSSSPFALPRDYSCVPLSVSVRSVDAGGTASVWAQYGSEFVADFEAPRLRDAGHAPNPYTAALDLSWDWAWLRDDCSPVRASYGLGTVPGGDDVVGETPIPGPPFLGNVSPSEVMNFTFSNAPEGVYYFWLRLWDEAGNERVALNTGVAVDRTPPTAPVITVSPPRLTNVRPLHWAWNASTDASGISQYEVSVVVGGQVRTELLPAEARSYDLDVIGGTWDFFIHAIDSAGWRSNGTEGPWPVALDTQPPAFTQPLTGWVDGSTVHFAWAATDNETWVANYRITVGTTPGGSDVVDGLLVGEPSFAVDGKAGTAYFATVTALDQAGNEAVETWNGAGVQVPPLALGEPLLLVLAGGAAAAALAVVLRRKRGAP